MYCINVVFVYQTVTDVQICVMAVCETLSRIDATNAMCYKTKLFDLIKCSHGFNAIVTAMFMALMIFISAIRKMKLMYLWLRVTHSCNLPIYGKLEINERMENFTIHFVSTKFCPNTLSALALAN